MEIALMKKRAILKSLFLVIVLAVVFVLAIVQNSVSEVALNDNVNIEGDIFLEGNGCGINFSDGSYQTTGASPPWSQKITEGRFVLVLDDEAVLDRETGLVWERDTRLFDGVAFTYTWEQAHGYCNMKYVGFRAGWRLPTIYELSTLLDPSNDPALPEGHPFTNVHSGYYWSTTSHITLDHLAWAVNFSNGVNQAKAKTEMYWVRAVRSGL